MGRPAKPKSEQTTAIALRVRTVAYEAACERAGGRDALIERLRGAVESFARPAVNPDRPARPDPVIPDRRDVTPLPKTGWK